MDLYPISTAPIEIANRQKRAVNNLANLAETQIQRMMQETYGNGPAFAQQVMDELGPNAAGLFCQTSLQVAAVNGAADIARGKMPKELEALIAAARAYNSRKDASIKADPPFPTALNADGTVTVSAP